MKTVILESGEALRIPNKTEDLGDKALELAPTTLVPGTASYVDLLVYDASNLPTNKKLELDLNFTALDVTTGQVSELQGLIVIAWNSLGKLSTSALTTNALAQTARISYDGNPTLNFAIVGNTVIIQGYREAIGAHTNTYSGRMVVTIRAFSIALVSASMFEGLDVIAAWEASASVRDGSNHLLQLSDLGPHGFDMLSDGAATVNYNAADATMNNLPTFRVASGGTHWMQLANNIAQVASSAWFVVVWCYSADTSGGGIFEFGESSPSVTPSLLGIFADIGPGNTYVYTDNVTLSDSYSGSDVQANTPFCLIWRLQAGAVANFWKNSAMQKALAGNVIGAVNGYRFKLGGATGKANNFTIQAACILNTLDLMQIANICSGKYNITFTPGPTPPPVDTAPAGASNIWKADWGLTLDGSNNVQAWLDSASYATLAQSNASLRPTVTANNANFGGKPTLNTTGTQYLTCPARVAVQPNTVCVIWKANALSGNTPAIFDSATNSADRQVFYMDAGGTHVNATANASGSPQITSSNTITTSDTLAAIGIFKGSASSLILKGITTSGNTGSGGLPDLRVFGANSGGLIGQSSIYEIRIYPRDLTTTEIAQYRAYAAAATGAT